MGHAKRRYRKNSERRVYIRGERHDPPDAFLLARALLDMAAEMANAQRTVQSPQELKRIEGTDDRRQDACP